LAQLEYNGARLRACGRTWSASPARRRDGRAGGRASARAPGESQIEIDRRLVDSAWRC